MLNSNELLIGVLSKIKLALGIIFVLVLISCKKNRPPNVVLNTSFVNDRVLLNASATTDPDGDALTFTWENNRALPFFEKKTSTNTLRTAFDVSGKEIEVEVIASDGQDASALSSTVKVPDYLSLWGLNPPVKFKRNDCNYEWYLTQKNTGVHSNNNCGPTSAVMGVRWADESFTGTPEQARQKYVSDGGWWYTNNIVDYLNLFQVFNGYIKLDDNLGNLIAQIDRGNVAILCIDAHYISENTNQPGSHVGRPYPAGIGFGHFIVVKGYIQTSNELFFEIYDPNSWSTFSDGSWVGENRYYRFDDIKQAAEIWWNWAIIISKNPVKSAIVQSDVPIAGGG